MSTSNQPLCEFITRVPECLETTVTAVVLKMFGQHGCDRVAILNQQRSPIGMLHTTGILPQLLSATNETLDLQQPISTWGQGIIEPISTLSADCGIEQLTLLLASAKNKTHKDTNWALTDKDGKFLGLLDSGGLLQFWLRQQGQNPADVNTSCSPTKRTKTFLTPEDKALIPLLERLPWPLMLETSTGEVVMQNPAWWQQLGNLKDLEGIKQQVKAILAGTGESTLAGGTYFPVKQDGSVYSNTQREGYSISGEDSAEIDHIHSLQPIATTTTEELASEQLLATDANNHHCFWDDQLGSCICIVQMQNNQERIWQFSKIPLDIADIGEKLDSQSPAGDNHLWLVLATDVTEQQQLCQELATKNADLIQLNRLKDEFLACISHELKTPLTAVLGLSRLLVDQQLGELNERQARYAGLIHQSGRHLMSVVNDILDLTRMETGQMELTLAPVNIRTVCDRAYDEANKMYNQTYKGRNTSNPEANSHEHQFTLSIEPGLQEMIADELRLRQMLVHLLSNAFKFTEISGEIGLNVNCWEGWIAFTVWDTGIGIPEHQQHLIFQKFQQLENTLTRQFEGTGLGLVLTRALARLHGGDVSFLSTEGKGSRFTLLLPPSPPKTGFGEPEAKDMAQLASDRNLTRKYLLDSPPGVVNYRQPVGMREVAMFSATNNAHVSQRLVLVVEAVARYIEDVTEKLTALGYRVVIARSGTEALEKARRLQPQVIFINPLLPLLSGWDVLTLIKSDRVIRQIPVIVTATAAEKEQAFANMADGFLSLPVQHHLLAQLLDSFCESPADKNQEQKDAPATHTPLRILRLIHSEEDFFNPHPQLPEHRVIEVDDLEQAELLARVWQFDLILLDREIANPQTYLQKLSQHRRLKNLPLVICDVKTTQAASLIPELSVFPCLTPLNIQTIGSHKTTEILRSVLQIAAGRCCPPNILVVDVTSLPDLPGVKYQQIKTNELANQSRHGSKNGNSPQDLNFASIHRGSEWLQALIQYLQTAGFKATLGRSWAELLQQLRHQSVDLLLICLTESTIQAEVLAVLEILRQITVDLPPVLTIVSMTDRVLTAYPELNFDGIQAVDIDRIKTASYPLSSHTLKSIKAAMGEVVTQVLPRSISMEELLDYIYQALAE
ncbi:MAG: hybrid sensor histidine kinase/response regulator [Calothrix sp. MO_167.B12]|nr:hybrid sensor histidine kinase/response regulator [Calothrix sp. MO_167.B12]